jgi:hypothetical protein
VRCCVDQHLLADITLVLDCGVLYVAVDLGIDRAKQGLVSTAKLADSASVFLLDRVLHVCTTSCMAFGVVPNFCSSSTAPDPSNMQYQLDRSPRSNPIVSFRSPKSLVCFVAAVLTFFIAGLLYLLCFEHVDNLGAYSIPSETGLLIPLECFCRVITY